MSPSKEPDGREGKYFPEPDDVKVGKPTETEGKYKDIPSVLPLAPGGVYAVKWEQREKWSQPIQTPEVPYDPPLGPPNPSNPRCFFEIRAGGYYLGRVVLELKADTHPVTSENFLKLCEYKCYAGTMFKVFPGNWIRGGDFTELDEVVYDARDPDFFDFATLLPNAAKGGQSIYVTEDGGPYFADESFAIAHGGGPGVLTMYNPGAPDCNGSQFMITYPNVNPAALDGTHVAFGQVIEGWNVVAALEQLGDSRQEGDTFQRITIERCGVVAAAAAAGDGAFAVGKGASGSSSVTTAVTAVRARGGARGRGRGRAGFGRVGGGAGARRVGVGACAVGGSLAFARA